MSTVSFGFSAQSDEARHMTLGIEVIKFLLEQDPANVPIVQGWIDKWFWRGYRLLSLVAAMMDYMLPKRVMSWAEAWEIYYEQNGGALFKPTWRATASARRSTCGRDGEGKAPTSATSSGAPSTSSATRRASRSGCPRKKRCNGCRPSTRTPLTSTTARATSTGPAGKGRAHRSPTRTLPQLCQVCQWPLLFTEPDDPTQICYREGEPYLGEKFHFCSDGCKDIFARKSPRSTCMRTCRCTRSTRAATSCPT